MIAKNSHLIAENVSMQTNIGEFLKCNAIVENKHFSFLLWFGHASVECDFYLQTWTQCDKKTLQFIDAYFYCTIS